jgi:hypothetical protein
VSGANIASERSGLAWLWMIPLAAVAGGLAPISPMAALGAVAVAAALLLLAMGHGAIRLFLVGLTVLLIGYAFLGRGFAYLGVPPVYVGEIALGLGCFALLTAVPTRRVGLVQVLIGTFMLWGAVRTVPYLEAYGLDALRDAVTWGYGAFALVVSLIVKPGHIRSLVSLYGRFLPLFIAWVPVFALIRYGFPEVLPAIPGTDVPIAFFKAGDLAVHLAGTAAFILAGLYSMRGWRGLVQPLLWAAWIAGFGVVAVVSRGGMLAVATVSALVLFVRSPGRWAAPMIVGLTLLGFAVITDVEFDIGRRREVSAAQLVENIQSVLGESDDPALADTRQWREAWWAIIIGYTIEGPYLWEGKGFGINLADDDGFQTPDESLRAPHNAHLNLLARSGLPGLALWVAVQVAFALTLLRAARAAARSQQRFLLAVIGWVFVYWLAALLNMSFDVYLEGPQGGILFWTLIGLGLAAASCVREEEEAQPPPRSVDAAPGRAATPA